MCVGRTARLCISTATPSRSRGSAPDGGGLDSASAATPLGNVRGACTISLEGDAANQTVWAIVVLAGAVIIGRAVDRTLRRRWGGRFNSPWGEPEVTPAREGAGLILVLAIFIGATLLARACPFPHIE